MFLTIFLGLSLGSGKVFGVSISSTSVSSAMEREILGTGAAVRLTGANAEHAAMTAKRRATVKERIVGLVVRDEVSGRADIVIICLRKVASC